MPQKKTLLYLYLYAWGKNTASKQINNYFWGERPNILSKKQVLRQTLIKVGRIDPNNT